MIRKTYEQCAQEADDAWSERGMDDPAPAPHQSFAGPPSNALMGLGGSPAPAPLPSPTQLLHELVAAASLTLEWSRVHGRLGESVQQDLQRAIDRAKQGLNL